MSNERSMTNIGGFEKPSFPFCLPGNSIANLKLLDLEHDGSLGSIYFTLSAACHCCGSSRLPCS